MLQILKGHLVHARSVRNLLTDLFGIMHFTVVDSCTPLVRMPSGRHSVRYVMGEIVQLLCILVYPCFISITGWYYRRVSFEKLYGRLDGPVWDLQQLWVFWGSCGSQLKYFAICILGSLDVVPGESSTLTLFWRVMDTFDDDDDEQPLSLLVIYIWFYHI